jgi:hypothetical protein
MKVMVDAVRCSFNAEGAENAEDAEKSGKKTFLSSSAFSVPSASSALKKQASKNHRFVEALT